MSCHWQTRRNRDTITFDEWVDLDLSRSGKGIANAYRNFVVRCKHEAAVVVLTAPAMGGRVAYCFKQPSVDEVNGFRRGLNLYRYAVSHTPYGDERVEKKQIENAAQLWKRDPLIGIHGIPDLNGAWVGEGISNCEVDGEPVR